MVLLFKPVHGYRRVNSCLVAAVAQCEDGCVFILTDEFKVMGE